MGLGGEVADHSLRAGDGRRIKTCWKKYARRNRELAHLASNLLILLALLYLWGKPLDRQSQHCLVGPGLFNHLSPDQAVRLVLHDG
jgi:hypothetical protein